MIEKNLTTTLSKAFLDFSAYNIQRRSIPDCRDGLKWSGRQLLHAQWLGKLTYNKPFKKALKSVAQASSFSYPHGDSSCYGTFIRMAKPFAYRYPLQEAKGNFGTLLSTDDHSASRYVELRGSKLAYSLFSGLEKNTVDEWEDTYDLEGKFPKVLPSIGFYGLTNGAQSIGSGMACSIPSFNLREINNSIIKLLKNEEIDFDEIFCPPDFPTGATIINLSEVKESLQNGHGKACKIRAKIDYNAKENYLIVTELPYSVYTSTICKELAQMMIDDENCGFSDFSDYTGEKPNLKIYISKGFSPEKVIQKLYSSTSLQSHFGINMVLLDNGKAPKIFGFREALLSHISHIRICKKRELQYDLQKLNDRIHILNALLIAIENIDTVIEIIRKSDSVATAKQSLQINYNFTEDQVKAILDIKLARLAKLEWIKINNEKEKAQLDAKGIEEILLDSIKLDSLIIKEIDEVTKEFGDERRTTCLDLVKNDEDLVIEEKKIIITLTNNGVISSTNVDNYVKQSRGGKGKTIKLNKNDFIVDTIYSSTTDNLLAISNLGKSYTINAGQIEIGQEIYVQTLIILSPNERIIKIVNYNKINEYKHIFIITKNGIGKKTKIEEYKSKRKNGLQGIKLKQGDNVAAVLMSSDDNDKVIIASKSGKGLLLNLSDFPEVGRVSQGIKAISLIDGDFVCGAKVVNNNTKGIISIISSGQAKITSIDQFNVGGRAKKGVQIHKLDVESFLVDITIDEGQGGDIIIVSSNNIIRFPIEELRKSNKYTIGSQSIKLKQGEVIMYIAQIEND